MMPHALAVPADVHDVTMVQQAAVKLLRPITTHRIATPVGAVHPCARSGPVPLEMFRVETETMMSVAHNDEKGGIMTVREES